jgi:hypothetical protein
MNKLTLYVKACNRFFPNIKGFYEEQNNNETWVAIINPRIPVTKC